MKLFWGLIACGLFMWIGEGIAVRWFGAPALACAYCGSRLAPCYPELHCPERESDRAYQRFREQGKRDGATQTP